MGTHPSVPSKNVTTGENLRDIVTKNEELLNKKVIDKFGKGELPYLFKVLSINKALSIQAHPDKELGAILHKRDPKNYPDPNHKPEMAIAVTEFEGFCGFKPLEQIVEILENVPEFVELVGSEIAQEFIQTVSGEEHPINGSEQDKKNKNVLQKLFGELMRSSDDKVADAGARLIQRAQREPLGFGGPSSGDAELANLLIRLNGQFPNDIGLFCGGLLLNYVKLSPGEAMFLRAKDPHAYISGDIIECMAASDNVVRAGFTPKFKDIETLVSMLTYSYSPVIEQKMEPLKFPRGSGENTEFTLYNPPIDEFAVLQAKIQPGAKGTVKAIDGPSILVSTGGRGIISGDGVTLNFDTGNVFFVGAGVDIELKGSGDDEFITYRAFAEVE